MKFYHFCDCGPHFHCGETIVHLVCQECGAEYIGPDCDVTRPLPVSKIGNDAVLCQNCVDKAELPIHAVD